MTPRVPECLSEDWRSIRNHAACVVVRYPFEWNISLDYAPSDNGSLSAREYIVGKVLECDDSSLLWDGIFGDCEHCDRGVQENGIPKSS